MHPITRISTLLMACAVCFLSTACTTIKPVYNEPQASIATQLKPGDRVRLTMINDRVKEVRITAVDETGIRGTIYQNSLTQKKGAVVDEEWADIFAVETVRLSPVKTAGAAVGIAAAVPFVALGLFFAGAGY